MYIIKCFHMSFFAYLKPLWHIPRRAERTMCLTSQNSFLPIATPIICIVLSDSSLHLFSSTLPLRMSKPASLHVDNCNLHSLHISNFASNHLLYLGSTEVYNLSLSSYYAHQQPSIVPNQPRKRGSTHIAPSKPYSQRKTSTYCQTSVSFVQ